MTQTNSASLACFRGVAPTSNSGEKGSRCGNCQYQQEREPKEREQEREPREREREREPKEREREREPKEREREREPKERERERERELKKQEPLTSASDASDICKRRL